jgi:VWFA-related protein
MDAVIEGAYGMFDYKTGGQKQIWVAGGIGVTPFLSFIRDMNMNLAQDVDFYYTVRHREEAVFVDEIEAAAEKNPRLKAHVRYSSTDGSLTVEDIVKNAGRLISNELRTSDLMMIVSYNHRLSAATGPTGDKEKLMQAIAALKPEYRRTALFDGLAYAMDQIKSEWGRKIIVVCSDGQDNASRLQLVDITESLSRASDYTVFALGTVYFDPADTSSPRLGAAEELRRGRSNLEALASITGGYSFFPARTAELEDALGMLQNLIRNQYSLSYHPTNSARDGSWRKITIACKRKGVRLRYREGYFAHS